MGVGRMPVSLLQITNKELIFSFSYSVLVKEPSSQDRALFSLTTIVIYFDLS